LGVFLLIDCLVLLIWVFQFFRFYPENEAISAVCLGISFIAEASFCLWLLIKGVNVERAEKHTLKFA